jgi:hypothetical protein
MGRLRNQRHELFAQALAEGKSRVDAMLAAGYAWNRGNQNRLASFRTWSPAQRRSENTARRSLTCARSIVAGS